MKPHQKIAAIFAAVCLSLPAFAEERESRGFYVAPEVGLVKIKDYCGSAPGITVSDCEDSEIGFGISGGYQFNEFFAAELGARFASGFDATVSSGGSSFDADTDFQSFSVGGRANLPLGANFALTGKAGFHFWDQEVNVDGSSLQFSEDGTDPYFGAGAELLVSEEIGIRAEYTRFTGEETDADLISASAVIRF